MLKRLVGGFAALVLMAGAGPAFAGYADDRAEIEDLQARYMFAMDRRNAAAYAGTFTEDGTLDWAGGVAKGRAAIAGEIGKMAERDAKSAAEDKSGLRPHSARHFISNVTLDLRGDVGTGRAYWHSLDNNNEKRSPEVTGYGIYEDEFRKVNGKWLFSKRTIWNQVLANRSEPTPAR